MLAGFSKPRCYLLLNSPAPPPNLGISRSPLASSSDALDEISFANASRHRDAHLCTRSIQQGQARACRHRYPMPARSINISAETANADLTGTSLIRALPQPSKALRLRLLQCAVERTGRLQPARLPLRRRERELLGLCRPEHC